MRTTNAGCRSASQEKTSALLPEGLTDTICSYTTLHNTVRQLLEYGTGYSVLKGLYMCDVGRLFVEVAAHGWLFCIGQVGPLLGMPIFGVAKVSATCPGISSNRNGMLSSKWSSVGMLALVDLALWMAVLPPYNLCIFIFTLKHVNSLN